MKPNQKSVSWKMIFSLGEQLLNQSSLIEMRNLIISTIQDWFSCKVNLWLPETFLNPGEKHDENLNFEGVSEEKLLELQTVCKNRKPVYKPNQTAKYQIIFPITLNQSILGLLELDRTFGNAFSPSEIQKINGAVKQVGISLHSFFLSYPKNENLILEAQRKAEQFASIIEISSSITSSLDLNELLSELVEKIYQILNRPYVFFYTVHPGRKKIFLQAYKGIKIENFNPELISFDLDDTTLRIPLTARTGKSELFSNFSDGQELVYLLGTEIHCQTELILPIVWRGEVLGVLDLISEKKNAFSVEDEYILEGLSNYIGAAIRNATLYRSEQWRRKAAESVREVAGLLTADTDLESVLDRILTELEKTLPCDFAVIWLFDDNQSIYEEDASQSQLIPAAVHISWQTEKLRNGRGNFSPPEVIQICKDTNIASLWLIEALSTDKPLIRTPGSPYEPLGSILDFPENYSSIAAPLRIGEQKLGVLSLGHHTAGRYGHESQTMTATFASYAAVAIQNARLYEAAHDQAWISTVLLQVAEATQSLESLEELLETMARITPRLIGVNACAIFLWESSLQAFLPISFFSTENNDDVKINDLVIFPEDSPAFLKLIQTKAPTWCNPEEFEENKILYPLTRFLSNENSFVLIPMLVRNEILGAFLIDLSPISQVSDTGLRSNQLEEKFAIIQGIAHQAALAVENLQLIKSQKEEAYVSIALLQVAQAVVSLNELEETLETIVRITPILVGVKRAVVFLWDEEKMFFQIAQSYGITRNELLSLPGTWSPEQFPLLGAVLQKNAIVYHEYTAETEAPCSWEKITSEMFSVIQNPLFAQNEVDQTSDIDLSESYLNIQSNLLFAYPLSVKGEFLGAMITQELEHPGEVISAQSRSRRQEITIGITQQAALAIQNDKLQSEVVERERLERELQLAREIQQTFLPDRLPVNPGWDLDVLWKPAREVGGDFYDVFELPGNRLGVVIADVADKGMPAALFMTLVRTLIRATAREELSPSAVLEVVNDLLVKDTKHGLFITVAYAVISLDTGKVIYANAGHNLPLLIRHHTRQLDILDTTGMALGVLEGIHIADQNTELYPLDCLILYTDGVTEAFSPEGEMFGENRLREIILSETCATARQQLQVIDQAVQDFIGDLPYSDDITILTVCRSGN